MISFYRSRLWGRAFFIFLLSNSAAAWPTAVSPSQSAHLVSMLQRLEQEHWLGPQVDAKLSWNTHLTFMRKLDPQRLFQTQGNKQALDAWGKQHEQDLKKGRLDAALGILKLFFMELTTQRQELAPWRGSPRLGVEAIPPVRFSSLLFQKPLAQLEPWQAKVLEDYYGWVATGLTSSQAFQKVIDYYDFKKTEWETMTTEALVDLYLVSVFEAVDPHSRYIPRSQWQGYSQKLKGAKCGIGVDMVAFNRVPTISHIDEDSPAHLQSVLKVGDQILEISQDGVHFQNFQQVPVETFSSLLLGEPQSEVHLTVKPQNETEVQQITIRRDFYKDINLKVSGNLFAIENEEETFSIGLLRIPSFYDEQDFTQPSVSQDVLAALKEFEEQKDLKLIVIDLRGNPGGLMRELQKVLGFFLGQQSAFLVQEKNSPPLVHRGEGRQVYFGPLMVLMDRYSASASELFAAAVIDHHRALVVGDSQTYGKGSQQTVTQIENPEPLGLIATVMTQALCYRINGKSTQVEGVCPHVRVSSLADRTHLGEKNYPHAIHARPIEPLAPSSTPRYVTPPILHAIWQGREERLLEASKESDSENVGGLEATWKLLYLEKHYLLDWGEQKDLFELALRLGMGSNESVEEFGQTILTFEYLSIGLDYLKALAKEHKFLAHPEYFWASHHQFTFSSACIQSLKRSAREKTPKPSE